MGHRHHDARCRGITSLDCRTVAEHTVSEETCFADDPPPGCHIARRPLWTACPIAHIAHSLAPGAKAFACSANMTLAAGYLAEFVPKGFHCKRFTRLKQWVADRQRSSALMTRESHCQRGCCLPFVSRRQWLRICIAFSKRHWTWPTTTSGKERD